MTWIAVAIISMPVFYLGGFSSPVYWIVLECVQNFYMQYDVGVPAVQHFFSGGSKTEL